MSVVKPQVPQRVLGGTGLSVSVLGYGGSALGSVFHEINEEEGIKSVHEAAKLGINVFDTSPFYGETRAEQVLGKALASMPVAREDIIVCSKCGRYGEAKFDFSRERILSSIPESLERLGLDYLDIVYCHDIEFGDLDQVINETIPTLRQLRDQGILKFIGVSGLPLKSLAYIVERTEVDVILSYCHYTLLDTTLVGDKLLPLLKEKNLGIVNASPLCMGILTPGNPPAWHPAPQPIKDAVVEAREICQSKGLNIAELSLKWALSTCKDVHMTLVSMPTVDQVRMNVQACINAFDESGESATEKQVLGQIQEIFKPVKDQSWPSGKAENN